MKCPHCQTEFHDAAVSISIGRDIDAYWHLEKETCPSCHRLVLQLRANKIERLQGSGTWAGQELERNFIRPRAANRPNPPIDVPREFAQDYIEASLVLSDSPKASAALSRRCLQHILREKAGVKRGSLEKEIDEVIASGQMPTHLTEAIDAIRNIGNFAAHPVKSSATGEILPVEPGEAEWTLDVLDGLFDFYFVQPSLLAKKRNALNAKLAEAKKPALK
jgi:Domain of unknown function (DUF4145)